MNERDPNKLKTWAEEDAADYKEFLEEESEGDPIEYESFMFKGFMKQYARICEYYNMQIGPDLDGGVAVEGPYYPGDVEDLKVGPTSPYVADKLNVLNNVIHSRMLLIERRVKDKPANDRLMEILLMILEADVNCWAAGLGYPYELELMGMPPLNTPSKDVYDRLGIYVGWTKIV